MLGCVCVKIQGRLCLTIARNKAKSILLPSQADARRWLRIIFAAKSSRHVTQLVAAPERDKATLL